MNDGIPPHSTPPGETRPAPQRELTLTEVAWDVEDLRRQLSGLDHVRREIAGIRSTQATFAGRLERQAVVLDELHEGMMLLLKEHSLELAKRNVQATVPA